MAMEIWWCVLKDSIDIVLKDTGFMESEQHCESETMGDNKRTIET
jgi:hypothetical protein